MVYKKLRMRFSRTGTLRFISHLDLCRSIRTALRRAKIPVRYSEGFSPHPRMTFTLPLPLGAQSLCEYMDILVPEESDPDALCAALDACTPPELHFSEAYVPDTPLTDAALSAYEVTFDGLSPDAAGAVLKHPKEITKFNKKGAEKKIDPAPMIRSYEVAAVPNGTLVRATLDCAPDRYLNPDQFAALFACPDYSILRTELYFADGRVFR